MRSTSNRRLAGVKRASAWDLEPPAVVSVLASTALSQEAQPVILLPASMSSTPSGYRPGAATFGADSIPISAANGGMLVAQMR